MFDNLGDQLYTAIIKDARYLIYLKGLGVTLEIAIGAVIIGIMLGILVAIVKVYAYDNRNNPHKGLGGVILKIFEAICNVYITIIRGTPTVIQLLIFYFVIFAALPNEYSVYVAMLAFGINSGAYVAEIIRAGIMAVDKGQTEAGRSLGLTSNMTMKLIILPQAIKNILPALGNELIVLVKETAIVGYIAVQDLTKGATLIQAASYQALVPLILAALIYLALVMLMTWGLGKLERRLRASDTH